MKTLTIVKNGIIQFATQFEDISIEDVHIADGGMPTENCPSGYSSKLVWDDEAEELKYVYEKTEQTLLMDRIAELERLISMEQEASQ